MLFFFHWEPKLLPHKSGAANSENVETIDVGVLLWQKHGALCSPRRMTPCGPAGLYNCFLFYLNLTIAPLTEHPYLFIDEETENGRVFVVSTRSAGCIFYFFIIEMADTVLSQAEFPLSQAVWIRTEKAGSGLLVWQAESPLHCSALTPLGWQLCAGHNLYNHKGIPWH